MKFDLEKAIKNEEYSRLIPLNNDILYDDYIFVLSAIYASNINLNLWINKFIEDNKLFYILIKDAQVVHCYDWSEAINYIIDICELNKYNTNTHYRSSFVSRNWVNNNLSPYLLNQLKNNNDISIHDIIFILNKNINMNINNN